MEEKRRHRRVSLEIPVTLHVAGQESYQATAKDISVGGMYISDAHEHQFGEKLTIEALLPGQTKPLELPGTVRWVKEDGFGVQFGLLGAQATHVITRILASNK